ncbi:ATP-dependent zinc metalloprotease FtsH [Empedobacter falsenii]|uniref:ATP-dependent zinc metalloprotease FtsH n=3 Tax=Empedobacter TaxID=59734 RepID=A0ABY8V7P0_9FLAO|nr:MULTISPECIES: ATP-dependent zinc metalloprotease FtsH [Empedobacter]MDM1522155.1 ATP-dependent metallopeptidase FtsH/Yme1/Tma family protein [Empedobacter sp. 225-1]MDM1542462.1 ATP-dependent metallopeptidase FtsH/Yme1/Tma family protein [Empedobacter sp. 189-2]WIH96941.1 ATP-dependent zinc metalloprotease FtsH [Empedobacter falsenii]
MKKNNFKPSGFNPTWIYGIIGLLLIAFLLFSDNIGGVGGTTKNIDRTTFLTYVEKGYVKEADLEKETGRVSVYLTEEALNNEEFKKFKNTKENLNPFATGAPNFTFNVADAGNFEKDFYENVEKSPNKTAKLNTLVSNGFGGLFMNLFISLIFFGLIYFLLFRRMGGGGSAGGGGGIFSVGKSKAKLFEGDDHIKTTFNDVAGLEGAKEEIEEIVEFLKHPDKFTKLGGRIPKGALLVGPPGTGKTLLAKAVAGEAKVPFFSLSGSDFVEMFVGVGASRVRDLFKNAKDKSPSIIFIDEIDAIGRARGKSNFTGSNDERENTLNQLLTEMDGFGTESNVIVIAATNRADVLDKALMRPGRFDRIIHVDLPELNERKEIFAVHLRPLKLGEDVEIEFLAKQTPGFSGADIFNVCNEAALVAARKNKEVVEKQDFLDAVDRIIGGLEKKSKVIKPSEKKRIAYHEAGHATIGWLTEHAAPLVKVTIVPRGRSLGAAWYLPEERQITTTEQLLDEMCMTMGGRAAEEVVFGNISTGALSDLEKVTKQANAMISIYGLNKEIGNVSYYDSSGQNEYGFSKPYSEQTAQVIDKEIKKMIEEQYVRAKEILDINRDKVDLLAQKLIEKEVIFREDLEEIFGPRKYVSELDQMEEKDEKTFETEPQQVVQPESGNDI